MAGEIIGDHSYQQQDLIDLGSDNRRFDLNHGYSDPPGIPRSKPPGMKVPSPMMLWNLMSTSTHQRSSSSITGS